MFSFSYFVLLLAAPLALAHDDHTGPHLAERAPAASIKSLFTGTVGPYPELDVSGPKPRSKWSQKLKQVKAAGKIPNIPPSKIVDYQPVYPTSYKGDPCSFYLTKCNRTSDITTGPKGVAGISFDDGPQPPSGPLLKYLSQQKLKATHFLIGSRIISNPDMFQQTLTGKQHLAVHTWSHPMMSSMTDEQVVGELGWTMQAIYDKSGLIPAYWRPSYGDVDDRVRAIAKQVFNLVTVTWSHDTRDWCLSDQTPNGSVCQPGDGPQSLNELKAELDSFIKTSLSKGLVILEHSIGSRQVAAFKYILPRMKARGWKPTSIPDMRGLKWYQ